MGKLFLIVALFTVAVLAACSSEPVEVTRVVETETEVEVEVTRIVETEVEVEVEVTRLVEIPVEVTRIVEEVVFVTPTSPPPTSTPDTPDYGSRGNPYPIGTSASLTYDDKVEFDFTVLEVIRGEEAWQRVSAANRYNDAAPSGTEYVMAKVAAEYTGKDEGILEVNKRDVGIVSGGRIFDSRDVEDACCLEPGFDFELLQGGFGEGWFAWTVPPDPEMTLKLGPLFFDLSGNIVTPDADAASTTEEGVGSETAQLDIDSFTDTWFYEDRNEDGDVRSVYAIFKFQDDSSYTFEVTTETLVGEILQEFIYTDDGSWEHQDGNTVCLTDQDGGTTCSQWVVEGDSLIRTANEGVVQVYTRQ